MTTSTNRGRRPSDESGPHERERLSRVEGEVWHLEQQVSSLSRKMDEGFDGLREAISNQKTPITQLAGWATVLLALVGAVLWPQLQTDQRHTDKVNKLSDQLVAHISDGHPARIDGIVSRNRDDGAKLREQLEAHISGAGHPVAITRIERNEKHITELDTQLQREMRLLDDQLANRITALDKRLQMEMRMLDDTVRLEKENAAIRRQTETPAASPD